MYPQNILITNICNQTCPFCFASQEMGNSTLRKEIDINDFKLVLKKISKDNSERKIKLLGGEPTLHSKLFDLLDLALNEKFHIQIFSNGIIGKKRILKLSQYGSGVGYTFNLSTPGFHQNKLLRNTILENIKMLGKKNKIMISLTITPYSQNDQFLKELNSILQIINTFRIGISNPIVHTQNQYSFSDYPKVGAIIINFIENIRKMGYKGKISLNCGFTRCMFTNLQYQYVKGQIDSLGWSCFGKESAMDIATDMTAFHCFPFSASKRIGLNGSSLKEIRKKLIKEHMILWSKHKNDHCLKGVHYGFGEEKCPGPCLAFQINRLYPFHGLMS